MGANSHTCPQCGTVFAEAVLSETGRNDALIQRVEGYLRDRNWTPSEANDLLMLCLAALRNLERSKP